MWLQTPRKKTRDEMWPHQFMIYMYMSYICLDLCDEQFVNLFFLIIDEKEIFFFSVYSTKKK